MTTHSLTDEEFERAIAGYTSHVKTKMRRQRAHDLERAAKHRVSSFAKSGVVTPYVPAFTGGNAVVTTRKPRAPQTFPEFTLVHAPLIAWCREPRDPSDPLSILQWVVGVGNQGTHSIKRGVRMKAEGRSPGFPDTILPVARGIYHGAALELKAPGGKPSAVQEEWLQRLRVWGWYTCWVANLDAAKAFYEGYARLDASKSAR